MEAEGAATLRALVGPLSGVCSPVLLQRAQFGELLVALFAFEAGAVSLANMLFKLVFGLENSAAHFAGVSESRVRLVLGHVG